MVRDDEREHPPPWWRRHLGAFVAGALIVTAGVLYVNSRVNPPPSPPNAATTQQLNDLRRDLDSYLAGRGGLRDQQYAKTVYTLCVLASDANETDILNDPDYDCAALLKMPPPSVTGSMPPTSPMAQPSMRATGTPSAPTTAATAARTSAPAASSSAPGPSASVTPTPSRTTASPATTPLVPGLLCALPTLPILPLCTGGTP